MNNIESGASFLCSLVNHIIFDQRPTSFLLLTMTLHFLVNDIFNMGFPFCVLYDQIIPY